MPTGVEGQTFLNLKPTCMQKTLLPGAPPEETDLYRMQRRKFLSVLGLTAATAVALTSATGCKKSTENSGVDLGSGDTGVLNYAYALEQLEAAFYTQVVASLYSGITTLEQQYLTDIRDHEIAHREFFKAALGGNAIPALEVDFSSINFSSRDSVLATAKAFEDLGVSAYNGAGKLLTDGNNLLIAGKIVSVEARHAALIRDLISNGTFADNTIINAQGLDMARTPDEVLAIAGTYVKTKLNASNLPTS
jgi:hypothetical protein